MKENIVIPEGYSLSQKAEKLINRALANGSKVTLVALSCPDYASSGEVYTFDGMLGEGVPLLTRLHADAIDKSIKNVNPNQIQIEVLLADIESENTSLVSLYTDGDYTEYQRRCDASIEQVGEYLRDRFPTVETMASSFMRLHEVGGTFIDYRNKYFEILSRRFNCDRTFGLQVENNVRNKQKSGYYKQEYGGKIGPDTMFQQELLTMAEYLSLGCMLGKRATSSSDVQLIVSHTTGNAYLFNKINDFSPDEFNYNTNTRRLPLMLREISVVAPTNTK